MRLSIIIVNFNGLTYLQRCLPAIFNQNFTDFELILVDNGSQDDSLTWLTTHYPQIQVIPNRNNLGFCIANNIGIRHSRGDYILLLNNDTEIEADFLQWLVTTADSSVDVGMVASQILFDHDPTRLDSAGIEVDFAGMAWNRHVGWFAHEEPTEPLAVFGPSAAAGLYKRAMLNQIGLFDETYFSYYEDVDLAWRAQRAGWRCLYEPRAKVRHVHSGTARHWPDKKAYLLGRNKLRTLLKNYPHQALWRHLPLLLFYELAAIGYGALLTGSTYPLLGRVTALRDYQTYLAKRRQFEAEIPTLSAPLSPAKPPHIAWKMHRGIPV